MTREEAIGYIKDVICENNTIKPNIVIFEQEKEALYMAIKALEQLTSYERTINKLTKAISEQATILDKIRAEILKLDDADYDFEGYYKAVTDALKIIDKYRGESDCRECKVEHDCYECKKYTESEES